MIIPNPKYQEQALKSMCWVAVSGDTSYPPVTTVDGTMYNKTAMLVYDLTRIQANGSAFGDNASSDAFGRLRVSQPVSLVDSKQLYGKGTNIFDEIISANATSVHVSGDALVNMSTNANGAYVIRQTPIRFNYQPGKGIVGLFTGVFAPETNITKRVGLFQSSSAVPYNPESGLYMEVTSSGPRFVVLKTVGTAYSVSAPQSAWNVDKLDGTGPSGLVIDFTKAQIFTIDYEWLGVGHIRFGFYLEGKCYYAHYVTNLNSLNAAYLSSPNHPIRYEIRQTGAGSGSMKHICSSVIIEGNEDILGTPASVSTSASVTVDTLGFHPVLSVRLNPARPDIVPLLRSVDLLNTSNTGSCIYKLVYNAELTGATLAWNDLAGTPFQYALGTNTATVTAGTDLITKFVGAGQGTSIGTGEASVGGLNGRFGVKINGTSENITIAAKGITNDAVIWASMNVIQRA
jgi:hypothetical protein